MKLILTGSSTGIGRALAERLLAGGHGIWGLARSDQSEFAMQTGGAFRGAVCDVSDWAQVERAAAEVRAAWKFADALVVCAGIQGEIGRTVTADPARWDATVRANLEGSFHAIRAFHTLLERSPRRAKIVCFSGGGATKPRPNFSAYGAAKTGIVRLVETIAEEEKDRPLDINAVAPGAINTRLTDEIIARGPRVAGEAEYNAALKQKAQGGQSLDKALGLVEWLLSPESDGVSGRLFSAQWDPWPISGQEKKGLAGSDLYTLRRILPEDRIKRQN
jgi:NAD(P)-dependent dehydrogenase (short-subunit alcohol dehydrogenase family)